jgi:hypothetical protein
MAGIDGNCERCKTIISKFCKGDRDTCAKILLNKIEQQQQEIEQLETALYDFNLQTLKIKNGEVDFTIGGENAKVFFNMLIQVFKQNGGKNFLCQTMQAINGNEKYSITIQNCNGVLSPEEKLSKLQQEVEQKNKALGKSRSALEYCKISACNPAQGVAEKMIDEINKILNDTNQSVSVKGEL